MDLNKMKDDILNTVNLDYYLELLNNLDNDELETTDSNAYNALSIVLTTQLSQYKELLSQALQANISLGMQLKEMERVEGQSKHQLEVNSAIKLNTCRITEIEAKWMSIVKDTGSM